MDLMLIERLHAAVSTATQATLLDGNQSLVVLAFDPTVLDADVWAVLKEDARRDLVLTERLEDLWDATFPLPDSTDDSRDPPAPLVLLAGERPTPGSLAEGVWRGPDLHALESDARNAVALRLSGKPLDPLHAVKAGARWAQSAVEGPITLIATTLGRKVGYAAQTAPDKARRAWKEFLNEVDRDRR